MLKKAFFILFLALGFNLSAQQVIDKVIAVVGKYPLLLSDFETYQIEKQK